MTSDAMRQLFEQAWDDVQHGRETDFVSGNNDADAVLLLQWVEERLPEHRARLEGMLRAWGGNASGSGIAHIDNICDVHPDTYRSDVRRVGQARVSTCRSRLSKFP